REGHPKFAVFPSCLRQLFSELQSDSRCFQPSRIQCTVSQPAPLPSKFGSPGLLLLNSQWRIDKRNNYSKNEEFSPIQNRSPHRTRQHLRSIFDSKRNKSLSVSLLSALPHFVPVHEYHVQTRQTSSAGKQYLGNLRGNGSIYTVFPFHLPNG